MRGAGRLVGSMAAAWGLAIVPTAARATCAVSQLVELKVTMNGDQPMVPVTINGHDEHFLVDSGAFFSNISSGKAAELGLKLQPLPQGFVVRGIGGEMTPSLTTVKSVGLAGLALKDVHFIVGGGEVGNGAGLIGQNVLGIGDVEYDLAHGAVRLMRAHDCKDASLAYWSGGKAVSMVTIEARDEHNPHTIGTILVNGVKLRATFDTGADRTVMSLAAAAKIGLRPDSPGVRAIGYSHGVGRRTVATYILPIDSIKLGDEEEIRRTHIRGEAADLPGTDMLIGADFFVSHRVYVANGMHRLFFTYDGGPIFNVTPGAHIDDKGAVVAAAPDTAAPPTDAAGFAGRGAASLARREYAKALADLDEACELAPTDGRYFYLRGQVHAANRQPLLAMDDLDTALKLDPGNAEARLTRASIRLSRHDRAAAEEDVAGVDKAAAPAADARLSLAAMYGALNQRDREIEQYDLWLRFHPDDSRRAVALNGRCWARAQLGIDLSKALSDCDAAIRGRPSVAGYLDSRGLVRLRMGDNDKAIRDYDAALALQPKLAWALYGRGLAKQRSGDKPGGDGDVAAAVAIEPTLPARVKAIGLAS